MLLKEYCSRYKAPKGWKWQDCKEDTVTLVRTRKVGKWHLDYKGNKIPRDAYMLAQMFEEGPTINLSRWEVGSYDPSSGSSGVQVMSRRTAIQESKCSAIRQDVWDKHRGRGDRAKDSRDALEKCRRNYGVDIF